MPENKSDVDRALQPVRFRGESVEIEFNFDVSRETVWATVNQIADLFDRDVNTIRDHIRDIYLENELLRVATYRNFRSVRREGSRQVVRDLDFYNLDMILSIGYRVSSTRATVFRQE
jgi:hypothetical protein